MKTLRSRFEDKYQFDKDTGCWNWTAYKDEHGYGTFWFNNIMTKAHRVSFELYVDPIPKGMYILHTCDNPSCVNPLHLRVGTQQDNMDDMHSKGRWKPNVGESHGVQNY